MSRRPEPPCTEGPGGWVLASSRISEEAGHLHAVDTRDHSTTILFPGPGSMVAPDAETYRSGPGAPTRGFQPHGIAEGVSLNSVTPLPDDAIAVTNFSLPEGEIWEWRPAAGWSEIPGSQMAGPNGIVSSEDDRWLYVGGWGEEALVRVSREGVVQAERESVAVGFHVDNVRWAPDGSLLVAGQDGPSVAAIGGCLNGWRPDRAVSGGVTQPACRVIPSTSSSSRARARASSASTRA